MDFGAQCFLDQRISGLLHPVVNKFVGAIQALDQRLTDSLPQRRVDLPLRSPENDREHRGLSDVSQTGEMLHSLLCYDRRTVQLLDHEVDDIVGITFVVNAIEVPGPVRRAMIEAEQTLFSERIKKLNHEEWVAGGLLMN